MHGGGKKPRKPKNIIKTIRILFKIKEEKERIKD